MTKDLKGKSDRTKAVHGGGYDPLSHSGAVNPPVYHVSTTVFENVEAYNRRGDHRFNKERMIYGVVGTPTVFALERAVADLEGAYDAVALPSGLTAISTALGALTKPGDHVLVVDTIYYPGRIFCDRQLSRIGVEVEYYDPLIGADVANLIRENTAVVYCESPGSSTFEVQDIPAIAKAARAKGAKVILDNTWGGPLYFKAFEHGVDLSVHAGTKHMGGHSDLVNGLVCSNEETWKALRSFSLEWGLTCGGDDAFLVLRGIRSMPTRMKQHQENALHVAKWLQGRPEVERVLYPALPGDPGHELWSRDFTGAAALFSVQLKQQMTERAWDAFIAPLELFLLGSSWGSHVSLISPASPLGRQRSATRWEHGDCLFRLHVGLEDPDDLIKDLEKALATLAD